MNNNIQMISTEKLYPHPDNPRKDLGDLTELSESIQGSGIFQNLTVVMHPTIADAYTVIIGHRRLEAAKRAGLTELPCAIAEMDHKEQLATMLLENMQRCDLTIIEQAQGIQMMMDLGESVEQIAKKTGLSKTTIYKRKNIAELDQEESKKALERGATLMDFLELEKVKDPEKKKELLGKMGTRDYTWAVERAITEEIREKNIEKILEMLQDYTKIDVVDHKQYHYQYLLMIHTEKDPKEIILPQMEDEWEYAFTQSHYAFSLYKRQARDNIKSEDPAKQEREKQDQRDRREAILELTKRSYQMRRKHIIGLSNNRIKLSRKEITAFLIAKILEERYLDRPSRAEEVLNIPFFEILAGKDNLEENKKLREEIEHDSERNLMLLTYLILDKGNESYVGYEGEYRKNDELEKAYRFAELLGYECSEEEMELRDGTHELYWKGAEANK